MSLQATDEELENDNTTEYFDDEYQMSGESQVQQSSGNSQIFLTPSDISSRSENTVPSEHQPSPSVMQRSATLSPAPGHLVTMVDEGRDLVLFNKGARAKRIGPRIPPKDNQKRTSPDNIGPQSRQKGPTFNKQGFQEDTAAFTPDDLHDLQGSSLGQQQEEAEVADSNEGSNYEGYNQDYHGPFHAGAVSRLEMHTQICQLSCCIVNGFQKISSAFDVMAKPISAPAHSQHHISHQTHIAAGAGVSRAGGKLTSGPMRRSLRATQLARDVRQHFKKLLGSNPFSVQAIVPHETAQIFANTWDPSLGGSSQHCCTASHFQIDLRGNPHSPWNQSAAIVFSLDFFSFHQLKRSESSFSEVIKAFYTRVKSLKAMYRRKLRVQVGGGDEQKKKSRMHQRKYDLFHRRLAVAQTFPPLHRHITILQRLGVDGMSDNESDVEDLEVDSQTRQHAPHYFVIRPPWRAKPLTPWLQMFDSLHILLHRMNGEPSQGAYPRQRIYNYRPERFSQARAYVSHLPQNAYDDHWLSNQHNVDFYVCPDDTPYSFTHGEPVMT